MRNNELAEFYIECQSNFHLITCVRKEAIVLRLHEQFFQIEEIKIIICSTSVNDVHFLECVR